MNKKKRIYLGIIGFVLIVLGMYLHNIAVNIMSIGLEIFDTILVILGVAIITLSIQQWIWNDNITDTKGGLTNGNRNK